jgi:hypothetical protein
LSSASSTADHYKYGPRYVGPLMIDKRAAMLRGFADFTTEIVRTPPEERGTPDPARALARFRLELSDLLYISLCFGFVPKDVEETVTAVGAALGISAVEVSRLTRELEQCVEHYRAIAVVQEPWPFWWMGSDRTRKSQR